MKRSMRKILFVAMLAASTLVGGCSSSVGVGLNVDVPIGDHAHLSFGAGSNRWY